MVNAACICNNIYNIYGCRNYQVSLLMLGIEELLAQSVGNCLQDYLHDGAPTRLIKTSYAVDLKWLICGKKINKGVLIGGI